MVTCGLCGHAFREDRSQPACRSCPLGADCGLVRCPECGYENPRDPAWLATLKGWLKREPAPAEADAPARRRARLPVLAVGSGEGAGGDGP